MAILELSIEPIKVDTPYLFKETGIHVFSFEEMLYHCYHYWRASIDDVLSGALEDWVAGTLGLTFISRKIKKNNETLTTLTDKFIAFISLENRYSKEEIKELKKQIGSWENKSKWEQEKAKGDDAVRRKDYLLASDYYYRACDMTDQVEIYNNLGVSLAKSGRYEEAERAFKKGLSVSDSMNIKMNLVSLYTGCGRYAAAQSVLTSLVNDSTDDGKFYYYQAKLRAAQNRMEEAETDFLKAIDKGYLPAACFGLCDLYISQRKTKQTFELLEKYQVKERYLRTYRRYTAKLFELQGDYKQAIKCVLELLLYEPDNIGEWTYLAALYRKDQQLDKALGACLKALNISPGNEAALLEQAKIKKADLKPKERQTILKKLLQNWKSGYHKTYDSV